MPEPVPQIRSDDRKSPRLIVGKLSIRSLLIALLVVVVQTVGRAEAPTIVVWSAPNGNDHEVYGSVLRGEDWGPAIQLASSDYSDVLPCAMLTDDGLAVVVWTRLIDVDKSQLMYVKWRDGDEPSDPVEIVTGLSVNTGVSMLKDIGGKIRVMWAGYDGSDDDIYQIRFEKGAWTSVESVNEPDVFPDVMPELGLGQNGRPFVTWMGFDKTAYRRFFSQMSEDESWTPERVLSDQKTSDYDALVKARLAALPPLPPEVAEPHKACVTLLDGHHLQVNRIPKPIALPDGSAIKGE